jgi:hypothetical protein
LILLTFTSPSLPRASLVFLLAYLKKKLFQALRFVIHCREAGKTGKETGRFDFANIHFTIHTSHFTCTFISAPEEKIIAGASLWNTLPGSRKDR